MTTYRTRRGAKSYGQAIGIIQLDCSLPFIPGDVDNASTYRYPVLYKVVPGLSTAACLRGAPDLAAAAVAAAAALEEQGVRAICSDCGFMLQFQEAVRAAVRVPVALSSLLQLPLIASSIAPTRPIAIITADANNLTREFLSRNGIAIGNKLIIRGLQDEPEFRAAVLEEKGSIDAERVEAELIATCRELKEEHRDLAAILLECSMLPPYSRALNDALDLPIFDFVTMIDHLYAATHPRRYDGFY
ncbi:MAG: aspartate/glutamate racemase family protein [Alphaproteobacteria bacterium]|nr:aspartate/glutamate racemase family protein [Alphaproteobacteria bacterium]